MITAFMDIFSLRMFKDACHDRGAPFFFLILLLNLGAYDLSKAKTDLEKTKAATG